jgi:hypothetical protein
MKNRDFKAALVQKLSEVWGFLVRIALIPKWSLRAWPVISFIPIAALHFYLFRKFPMGRSLLHKIMSSGFQTIGAILVIYSINDNIGVFKNKSLWQLIIGWFKSFPLISRSAIVGVTGVGGMMLTGSAEAWVSRKCNTVEERLQELEQQLVQCRELVFRKEREVLERIQITRTELETRISTHSEQINLLTQKIETSIIGGFKLQAFGVILAIYGAVVSIFA